MLLVEDDPWLREGLLQLLGDEGYHCRGFASVEAAGQELQGDNPRFVPDLCVLDRNLPGASGDDLCRRLRRYQPLLPILMLSARASSRDRVAGLKAGADDYLCKPFDVDELLARLAAMRRRLPWQQSAGDPVTDGFLMGSVRVDPQTMILSRPDGCQTQLQLRQLRLLQLLYQRRGKVVSRDELYNHGWGRDHLPNSRALDQYMVGLRALLQSDHSESLIESVRGLGYRYCPAVPANA
nr:response regulator transcription factor [Oceanobacter mangrovi]